jgi:sugar diacid utilization regulator
MRPTPISGCRTVAELVDDIGLEVLAGGAVAAARTAHSVVRIAVLDAADVHAIDDGALVIADGIAPSPADTGARLIVLLAERGACALGILADADADADADAGAPLPDAALAAADEHGLPVLRISSEHACDDVQRTVEIGRLRSEIAVLQRISSGGDYLMGAVREPRSLDELVDRLAWLLGGDVILFNDGGEAIIATSAGDAPAIWTAITVGPEARQDLELHGRHVTTSPVRIDGRVRYWLAVSTRREPAGGRAREAILGVAAQVIELLVRSRGGGAEAEDRAARAQLLSDALTERDPSRLAELSRRAERFGISFAEPCRVMLVLPAGHVDAERDTTRFGTDIGERLRVVLAGSRTPYLLDERPGEVAALLQGDCCSLLQRWVEDLADDGEHVAVGLGRPHAELRETRDSLLDARVVAHQIVGRGQAALLSFEDSDLTPWLIASVPPARLLPKVDAMLAEIRESAPLYETLTIYLACNLDLRRTAAGLHLHVNSVRYRLGKVEQALGRPLTDVATLADLYIAVTATRASSLERP